MGRGWLLLALAGVALAAPGPGRPEDVPAALALPPEAEQRIELGALVFPQHPPIRLLHARLRISGIDPDDVRRTFDAWNRRFELAQWTPDGVAIAPHVLARALDLSPDQLLQLRVTGQAARLVFRLTWR